MQITIEYTYIVGKNNHYMLIYTKSKIFRLYYFYSKCMVSEEKINIIASNSSYNNIVPCWNS